MFGKSGIGSSGTLALLSLTGSNGFAITGVAAGDYSGISVSGAGDINGDGVDDLIIGADGASPGGRIYAGTSYGDGFSDLVIGSYLAVPAGVSYVVFGKSGIGSSGTLALSSLTGNNGFAITGVSAGDRSGTSVSSAGDFNGDGTDDLIIAAPDASSGGLTYAGTSYVVFGDSVSSLLRNSLTIIKGQTVLMTSSNLNATYPGKPAWDPRILFTISAVQHGYFSLINNTFAPITSFFQQQLYSQQVLFSHDDSPLAPSFSTQLLGDGGLATMIAPQPAQITFIHRGAVIVNNQLAISQGQTVTLFSTQLSANDLDIAKDNPSLIFTVSNIQHGYFQQAGNPGYAITGFLQSQVQIGSIQFVHDGSSSAPSYRVAVSDGSITTSPQACNISFNLPPILINNSLTLNQGQTVILSSSMLSASDPDDAAAGLTFLISNVQHGQFELLSNPGLAITSFTQAQVQSGAVQFVSDGGVYAPSYSVAVSDGKITTPALASSIHFNAAPVLVNNKLSLAQGQTIIIDSGNLSAIDVDSAANSLTFMISNIVGGRFEKLGSLGVAINSFTQGEIQAGIVQFVQDGSPTVPSFSVAVSDGSITIPSQPSTITFNAAPILTKNQLTITEASSLILTSNDLSATDDHTQASDLVFTASGVSHGQFEDISLPGTALTVFAQQRISAGALRFVTDGSTTAPHYNISVSDGTLSTRPSPAILNFSPSSAATAESNNTIRNGIIGGTVSGAVGLAFFALRLCIARASENSLQSQLNKRSSAATGDLKKFYYTIVEPLAKQVFDKIKTTSILGYRGERDTTDYIEAIEAIVIALGAKGVNLAPTQEHEKLRIINEVAHQIKKILVPKRSCLSGAYCKSFYQADVTPAQMKEQAEAIAAASYSALGGDSAASSTPSALLGGESFSSSSPRDVEMGSDIELHDMKKVTLDLQESQRLADRIAKIEKHLGLFAADERGGSMRSKHSRSTKI